MKIIEVLKEKTENCKYDDLVGYYEIMKDGLDDIIIVKNYEYKQIKLINNLLQDNNKNKFIIEKVTNGEKYIVQPLDSLTSIANKFNKDESYIINKNKLKCKKLFIGQILEI